MTEPTRVVSQARAELMALTGNIRENLLQQFLSITTVTFTNTLLHSEDVAPLRAALHQCLHSSNTRQNTSAFVRGSQKSQKHGIHSYINKTRGEIKFPTGERSELDYQMQSDPSSGLSQVHAVRTPPTTRASREGCCPLQTLVSGHRRSQGRRRPLEQLTGSSGSGLKVWSGFQFGLCGERGNRKLLANTWNSPL